MTAEQRADVLMEQMPFQLGHLGYNYRQALLLSIKEAMREASLPAVPDVDIAEMLEQLRYWAAEDRAAGGENEDEQLIDRAAEVLEREHTARKVAERQLGAMREALKPFAGLANDYDPTPQNSWLDGYSVAGQFETHVTVGDLRAARAAFSTTQPPAQENDK